LADRRRPGAGSLISVVCGAATAVLFAQWGLAAAAPRRCRHGDRRAVAVPLLVLSLRRDVRRIAVHAHCARLVPVAGAAALLVGRPGGRAGHCGAAGRSRCRGRPGCPDARDAREHRAHEVPVISAGAVGVVETPSSEPGGRVEPVDPAEATAPPAAGRSDYLLTLAGASCCAQFRRSAGGKRACWSPAWAWRPGASICGSSSVIRWPCLRAGGARLVPGQRSAHLVQGGLCRHDGLRAGGRRDPDHRTGHHVPHGGAAAAQGLAPIRLGYAAFSVVVLAIPILGTKDFMGTGAMFLSRSRWWPRPAISWQPARRNGFGSPCSPRWGRD